MGIDDAEIGEFAYDYVELTREVLNDVEDADNASAFSAAHQALPVHLQQQYFPGGGLGAGNGREKMVRDVNNQPIVGHRMYGQGSADQ